MLIQIFGALRGKIAILSLCCAKIVSIQKRMGGMNGSKTLYNSF